MAALIAGWIAGYLMAMVTTVSLTYLLMAADRRGWLYRFVAPEVPGVLLAVPLFLGSILGWTMVGLIAGAIYEVADFGAARDGLGSPSLPITIGALLIAWLPLPPLVALSRRRWWLWAGSSVLFAGLFGWLLPHLAGK